MQRVLANGYQSILGVNSIAYHIERYIKIRNIKLQVSPLQERT